MAEGLWLSDGKFRSRKSTGVVESGPLCSQSGRRRWKAPEGVGREVWGVKGEDSFTLSVTRVVLLR